MVQLFTSLFLVVKCYNERGFFEFLERTIFSHFAMKRILWYVRSAIRDEENTKEECHLFIQYMCYHQNVSPTGLLTYCDLERRPIYDLFEIITEGRVLFWLHGSSTSNLFTTVLLTFLSFQFCPESLHISMSICTIYI